MEKPKGAAQRIPRVLLFLFLCVLLAITLVPFYSMFTMGTYNSFDLYGFNGLPSNYLLQNLKTVLATNMVHFFLNSVLVSAASVLFGVFNCALCGYGLAKYRFKGNGALFKIVLFTMMIPYQLSLVAYVYEMRILNLNNTLLPSIISFLYLGFGVFWMRQFIGEAVPDEIMESGRIDGAGELGIFFRLSLPLITPAIMTLSLLVFVWSWNAFLIPLITISKQSLYTLPLGMASFNGLYVTDNGAKLLALSLSTLPVIIVYLFTSNRLIGGLTAGAVKG